MRLSLRAARLWPMLFMCLCLISCGNTGNGTTTTTTPTKTANPITLQVFAAASLTESFKEIQTAYKTSHPDVTISYNFAGSQALVQQMKNGAKADVFASADTTNMQKAVDAGLVNPNQIFVQNKLAVIVPVNNPGKINTLKDLSNKGLKLVLAAPAVPVGKYAGQVLDKLGKSSQYGPAYEQEVKANVVSQEDNVKAVVQKVQLGEADAGIVYLTDITAAVSAKVKVIEIPNEFNVVASYPIASLKASSHLTEAEAFIQYLLSPEGQTILAKYRFIRVK